VSEEETRHATELLKLSPLTMARKKRGNHHQVNAEGLSAWQAHVKRQARNRRFDDEADRAPGDKSLLTAADYVWQQARMRRNRLKRHNDAVEARDRRRQIAVSGGGDMAVSGGGERVEQGEEEEKEEEEEDKEEVEEEEEEKEEEEGEMEDEEREWKRKEKEKRREYEERHKDRMRKMEKRYKKENRKEKELRREVEEAVEEEEKEEVEEEGLLLLLLFEPTSFLSYNNTRCVHCISATPVDAMDIEDKGMEGDKGVLFPMEQSLLFMSTHRRVPPAPSSSSAHVPAPASSSSSSSSPATCCRLASIVG
jgi:hypothetical protein